MLVAKFAPSPPYFYRHNKYYLGSPRMQLIFDKGLISALTVQDTDAVGRSQRVSNAMRLSVLSRKDEKQARRASPRNP